MRTSRTHLAAVLLASVVAVVALGACSDDDDSAKKKDAAAESNEAPVTREQTWAVLNDPTNSDLPRPVFDQLSRTATDIVKADVTGQGRDTFAGYWPTGGNYRPCCSGVTIHAAGARTIPGQAALVDVTVIWSGQRSGSGPPLDNQTSTIHFRQAPEGWQPVPPQSAGG